MSGLRDCIDPTTNDDTVYLAGQVVGPGIYRLLGSSREVVLAVEGVLPATCDGRVAEYARRAPTWSEIRNGPIARAVSGLRRKRTLSAEVA